jgi:hypothetical protein
MVTPGDGDVPQLITTRVVAGMRDARVSILPGGSYHGHAMDHVVHSFGRWLTDLCVTAAGASALDCVGTFCRSETKLPISGCVYVVTIRRRHLARLGDRVCSSSTTRVWLGGVTTRSESMA